MHGFNGVTFIDPDTDERWHTWDDWGLYLEEKEIGTPEVQEHTVEVPGREGVLDLTDALDGYTHYYNRELDFVFRFRRPSSYKARFTAIQRVLHGKQMKIILDEDDDHYYYGRCWVEDLTMDSGEQIGEIEITCDCEPYRTNLAEYEYTIPLEDKENAVVDLETIGTKLTSSSNGWRYTFGSGDSGEEPFASYSSIIITVTANTASQVQIYLHDSDGEQSMIFVTDKTTSVTVTIDSSGDITCDCDYKIGTWPDDSDGVVYDEDATDIDPVTFAQICKISILGILKSYSPSYSCTGIMQAGYSVTLAGTDKPVSPTIYSPTSAVLRAGTKTYEIDYGYNTCSGLLIHGDDEVYSFAIDAEDLADVDDDECIIITYTGGCL